jgi:4-hydroxy-3-methylbut-2-enyl diphosphate reductase
MLAEMEAEKKQKWAALQVGTKLNGVVRRLTDFGAFVDIGGIDGLVHVTDVAWGRVKHPSDVLKIGQQVEVVVLNVDVEKERVSLGYKQLQPKPWTMAGEKYPVGSVVEGKVVRIVPFGAFVALEPTIDGLIHISQISVRRIAKVEDEINVGDVVRCKVLDVNPEAKRISLSRKEVILEENPEIAEQLSAERAERDRQYAERQEQRAAERQQRAARPERAQQPRPERSVAPAPAPAAEKPERERRPRRSEDGDYDLPPVQTTTTSLADLFQGLNMDELDNKE